MSEEKKIKVVLLEPGKLARTAEIGTSLEDLQKIVDGLIEAYIRLRNRSVSSAMRKAKSTVCSRTDV